MENVEKAVIPKGTIINGNIEINGMLEMYGTMNGDIRSTDRVEICGSEIKGNITANELSIKDAYIEGNVVCEQNANVRENTVILGDVSATTLTVDGAIQGRLDVKGLVQLGDRAIVDSDIKAKSIQVSNGAAINGNLCLCYADVTPSSFFPATESEPEEKPAKTSSKSRKNA